MEVKFGMKEYLCQIVPPSVQHVIPVRLKTLKSPTELLQYQCLALHAMLPVMKSEYVLIVEVIM